MYTHLINNCNFVCSFWMSRLLATCYEHFFPIAIHAFHVSALDVRDRVECARVEKKTNANSSMRTNQKSLRTLNTMVHYSFRYKLARQRFVAAIGTPFLFAPRSTSIFSWWVNDKNKFHRQYLLIGCCHFVISSFSFFFLFLLSATIQIT